MLSRYVRMGEYLYIRVIIWVNTILNHIDTRVILPRYENFGVICKPKSYQKQNYRHIPIPIPVKKYEILIIDTQRVSKTDDTSPTLVQTTASCTPAS